MHELGTNAEKKRYAKHPIEIRKIKLLLVAIFYIAAIIAAILKKKVDEKHLGTERILCAETEPKSVTV